jgi:lipoprotein signal peptidase
MTETHGRVKTRGSGKSPVGAQRPGGAHLCATRPCRMKAGANQGATAWQARQHGRGESASQVPVTTPAPTRREAERGKRLRQRLIVLTLLVAVIMVDQAAKWWAWRHVPGAIINPGGDFLTGPTIGRWYANPVTGALLDLVDFGLVSIAAAILARRRCRAAVAVCGSLMIGGWASNLLDRLGMHYLTAPGSIRGAVDFISFDGRCWNPADFFIVGATPLLLLATARLPRCAANRPSPTKREHAIRNSLRARVPTVAVAGAALIMTVALGAAHHGGLTKPSHISTKSCPHVRRIHEPDPVRAASPTRVITGDGRWRRGGLRGARRGYHGPHCHRVVFSIS